MHNVADTARPDNVTNRQLVRLAAMLRTHLDHLPRRLHRIARLFGFGENIGEWLLYITVLARPHHLRAQLGMLKVARGNHHPIDISARQHILGVLIGSWVQVKGFLYLRRAPLPR